MDTEGWVGAIVGAACVIVPLAIAVVQWMLGVSRALATVIVEARDFREHFTADCLKRHGQHDEVHSAIEKRLADHEEQLCDHEGRLAILE